MDTGQPGYAQEALVTVEKKASLGDVGFLSMVKVNTWISPDGIAIGFSVLSFYGGARCFEVMKVYGADSYSL